MNVEFSGEHDELDGFSKLIVYDVTGAEAGMPSLLKSSIKECRWIYRSIGKDIGYCRSNLVQLLDNYRYTIGG